MGTIHRSATSETVGSFDAKAAINDDGSGSCEEMKDAPPSILAAQDILVAHGSILVRLEKRMQELELHCEQQRDDWNQRMQEPELHCDERLDALRASVEPPRMTLRPASNSSGMTTGTTCRAEAGTATAKEWRGFVIWPHAIRLLLISDLQMFKFGTRHSIVL